MRWLAAPASVQSALMRGDWYIFVFAAAAVALFVYGSIFWCLIAYRRSVHERSAQFTGNAPLEIFYAGLSLAIVFALFIVTYVVEMPVDHVLAHDVNRVTATAFRWSWRFDYPGTGIVAIGTPVEPPTLYLPVNRTTQIELKSADVTHSFWIPAFLFKRDAIPGMTNVFDLTPKRTGTFLASCAQFCGLEHASMTFHVNVVADDAYDRFVSSNGATRP